MTDKSCLVVIDVEYARCRHIERLDVLLTSASIVYKD